MSSSISPISRAILDAAHSLLSDIGEAFTIEQLEAKTNVSKSTIYRQIGSKKKLLQRLAQERGEPFENSDIKLSILKSARTVFGRCGIVAATMEQIASEAKVGVATVYRHFGDKERLVHECIEELTPKTTVRALALHPTEDVKADLEKIVEMALIACYENRDVLRLVLMGSEAERNYLERLRANSDSTLNYLSCYFQCQLDAGRLQGIGNPDDLALALMGMVLAFAIIGPLHYGVQLDCSERRSRFIVTLFLHNLLNNLQEAQPR